MTAIFSISNTSSSYPVQTFPVRLNSVSNKIEITSNGYGEFYFDINQHALHSASQVATQKGYVKIKNICSLEKMTPVEPKIALSI